MYLCWLKIERNVTEIIYVQKQHVRRVAAGRCKQGSNFIGMGIPYPEDGRDDLHRPARPLWHHAALLQSGGGRLPLRPGQQAGTRVGDTGDRKGAGALQQERQHPHRRDRDHRLLTQGAQRLQDAALHHRDRDRWR